MRWFRKELDTRMRVRLIWPRIGIIIIIMELNLWVSQKRWVFFYHRD